jgi:hypothetical protein
VGAACGSGVWSLRRPRSSGRICVVVEFPPGDSVGAVGSPAGKSRCPVWLSRACRVVTEPDDVGVFAFASAGVVTGASSARRPTGAACVHDIASARSVGSVRAMDWSICFGELAGKWRGGEDTSVSSTAASSFGNVKKATGRGDTDRLWMRGILRGVMRQWGG